MIENINIRFDSYFGQVVQTNYTVVPDSGPHAGHTVQHEEIYHNCGAMEINEVCETCGQIVYESEMNGCWQHGHQRPERGEQIQLSDEEIEYLATAETDFRYEKEMEARRFQYEDEEYLDENIQDALVEQSEDMLSESDSALSKLQ